MIGKRYKYDDKPLLQLNALQQRMKRQIDQKIKNGIYKFEKTACLVCGSEKFEILAEKDRYGLYMPVVICKRCGFIQTNPRMTQASYNEFYNSEYRKLYDGENTATEWFFQDQYRRGQQIFNYLKNKKIISDRLNDLSILEVGCGAGGILRYFEEKGCRVNGVDLGKEYIEYGRDRFGLNLSVGDITTIDKDVAPDIIIYSHVFEHILNPNIELLRIRSILPDTGFLYIEVPGIKYLMYSYSMDFLRFFQNAHICHFSLMSLRNILGKNGFQMISGNERIRSVFRISGFETFETYENDYAGALAYIKKVERLRKLHMFLPLSLFIKALKLFRDDGPIQKLLRYSAEEN